MCKNSSNFRVKPEEQTSESNYSHIIVKLFHILSPSDGISIIHITFYFIKLDSFWSTFQGLGWNSFPCKKTKHYLFFIHTVINNWRLSCKRGVCRFLSRISVFVGWSLFLADWLILTWKASFCWFALRFWEITYAKSLSFRNGILEANPSKADFDPTRT